jgi:hypothetical protein
MIRTITAAITTAAALCAFGAAFAQQPPSEAMQAVRAACAADYMKLCPVANTRDDRRQCMMANRDKFSDSCKAAIADMRSKMQMQAAPAQAPAPGDAR